MVSESPCSSLSWTCMTDKHLWFQRVLVQLCHEHVYPYKHLRFQKRVFAQLCYEHVTLINIYGFRESLLSFIINIFTLINIYGFRESLLCYFMNMCILINIYRISRTPNQHCHEHVYLINIYGFRESLFSFVMNMYTLMVSESLCSALSWTCIPWWFQRVLAQLCHEHVYPDKHLRFQRIFAQFCHEHVYSLQMY